MGLPPVHATFEDDEIAVDSVDKELLWKLLCSHPRKISHVHILRRPIRSTPVEQTI